MKKYYLTTPLYYVNAKPHIGHSYTTIAADALARFKRLMGYQVFFLTGTDEYGQKVQRASQLAGVSPKEFTDRVSGTFMDLWKQLDISFDDFIRTTEDRHRLAVKHIWTQLDRKGLIYQKKYEGWYCTPCETFWPYREIGKGSEDIKRCPQCGQKLEDIQEDNYFFAISKYQDWLIGYIKGHPSFIMPVTRRNETLSFLEKNKLVDLCISRPRSRLEWGIACPLSDDHVTYVWFDALINYISACGFPNRDGKMGTFWPCDVHLIGKDILRPHTVYWPMMLKALDLDVPHMVYAHGWWVQDKAKMSKSLGNVIDPLSLVSEFGCDALRFFLLREVPFGQDGTYSHEAITLRYNTDLANDLGNLLLRTLTMIEKYFEGVIQAPGEFSGGDGLKNAAKGLASRMEASMNQLQFHEALNEVWRLINRANKFIEESAPWKLAKSKNWDELKGVLISLCEVLRIVAQAIWPYMPKTGEKIWTQLGLEPSGLVSESFYRVDWNYFNKGCKPKKGEPLFPRRDTK